MTAAPRIRTRVKTTGASVASGIVRFVDRPDSNMLVVRDLSELAGVEPRGAYIKVMPTIRASERSGLDAAGIKQRLLERGATAVVVTPIVVPDRAPSAASPERRRRTAQQWLSGWFEKVHGVDPKVAEVALSEAVESANEAGL